MLHQVVNYKINIQDYNNQYCCFLGADTNSVWYVVIPQEQQQQNTTIERMATCSALVQEQSQPIVLQGTFLGDQQCRGALSLRTQEEKIYNQHKVLTRIQHTRGDHNMLGDDLIPFCTE
jgi:hypothetical protein